MAGKPADQGKIERAMKLYRGGMAMSAAAYAEGLHPYTLRKRINESVPRATPMPAHSATPDLEAPPIDVENGDARDVSIVTPDDPLTLEQVREKFGIGPEWEAESFKANAYQGFYKVKIDGTDQHRKVQLWQTSVRFKRKIDHLVQQAVRDWCSRHVPAVPMRASNAPAKTGRAGPGVLCVWGLYDAHLGMRAWRDETGHDHDLGLAVRQVRGAVDAMAAELAPYRPERVLIPIGNDFLHIDGVRHKTAFGDHELDVDSRFSKVYRAGLDVLAHMVDRALEVGAAVELLYVPGNHDTTTSYTLIVALAERYRLDKRVTADLSATARKYRRVGRVLLGFAHGDAANADQLSRIMPSEAVNLWNGTTCREIHTGHLHQARQRHYTGATPTNGITVRVHPCLCPPDAWHYKQGFIGEPLRACEAHRYNDYGHIGTHVAHVTPDEERP
jgi:hypothetical protein